MGKGPAKCDATLGINVHGEHLVVVMICDGDIFAKPTVERMTDCLHCLVHGLLRDPHAAVDALDILPPQQLKALHRFTAGALHPEYQAFPLFHEGFAELAARQPERCCLVFEGTEMSYGQVNAAADVLAASLAGMGMGPGAPVGIMLDRSFELVIAILGVLKAGGGSDVGLPLPVLHQSC